MAVEPREGAVRRMAPCVGVTMSLAPGEGVTLRTAPRAGVTLCVPAGGGVTMTALRRHGAMISVASRERVFEAVSRGVGQAAHRPQQREHRDGQRWRDLPPHLAAAGIL
jgi:hypothetical protein